MKDDVDFDLNMIANPRQPAYPCYREENGLGGVEYSGLTKREYFAAMALQGLLPLIDRFHEPIMTNICADAVAFADELLKHLEK